MKQYSREIKAIRKKLPAKGWIAMVMEFTTDKKKNSLVTYDQVRNLFQRKAVNKKDAIIIVKAAYKAVEKMERDDREMKELFYKS